MDPSLSIELLLLFTATILLSGVLGATKTVIGYYYGQSNGHIHNPENDLQVLIKKSAQAWQKPGFFESLSLGRFLLDGVALICLTRYFYTTFPSWSYVTSAAVGLPVAFLISHWLFPYLGRIFAPRLGNTALRIHGAYSMLLMGRIGEALYRANDFLLRRRGIDQKLSFLGDSGHQKPDTKREEEPDRSGLEDEEKEMIRSIFDLRETQVREIMTPRVDIKGLEINTAYEQVIEFITKEKFSRIPVYEENLDNIRGILHVMDLLAVKIENGSVFRLSDFIKEAFFVPRTKKIGELMREFRQKHVHMGMVVDEYGGTAGLITLEDILEEIVGEIHDEDEIEAFKLQREDDGVYLIDPILSLSDLQEETGIDLKPEEEDIQIDTVGGFILFIHGKVPEIGDLIRYKDYSFEIIEMDGQKLELIRLLVNSPVNVRG